MRTTVTLDPDVERLLKTTAHRRGKSFKVVLNEAVRQSLGPKRKSSKPIALRTFALGIHPHFAHRLPTEIADELEVEEYLARARHSAASRKTNGDAHP